MNSTTTEAPLPVGNWFKTFRSPDALELLEYSQNAFLLLYLIAYRARWRDGISVDGLSQGEALLGDYENIGLTEQMYRTAKLVLEKCGFATFRTTNKGTIARLINTRVFSISNDSPNGQNNGQPTDKQRTSNGQTTTNKTDKKGIREECKNKTHTQPGDNLPLLCPTEAECRKLFTQLGKSADEGTRFHAYYELNGWPSSNKPNALELMAKTWTPKGHTPKNGTGNPESKQIQETINVMTLNAKHDFKNGEIKI
jgi:hypothetical protein